MLPKLDRLTRVDLRAEWAHEATIFTPWLAQPENLALLSETLRMELELEAQESAVGPFRADILCKEIGTDRWVLIENQLERTDHGHLGQVLTYASGLGAATIIWIAARFTDEHRSTLDWLNKITDESFQFFGLEVELWRIGDSLAAPKFNIVSKPNEWSRAVKRAANSIDERAQGPLQQKQLAFWDLLHDALDKSDGPISGQRKAQPDSWMSYSIGKAGFSVNAAISQPKQQLRAEIYISGSQAAEFRDELYRQCTEIEADLGRPLIWQEMDDRRDRRIYLEYHLADFTDEAEWPAAIEWLTVALNDLHNAFAPRIRLLSV